MADKKFYLTKQELGKLKKEYEDLASLKLKKTKGEVPDLLQSEDLNPEYLSFLEDLSLLEARLADLDFIFKNSEIIKPPPQNRRNIIDIGAQVLVEVDSESDEFEIVGTLEANPALGKISNESPVGRALLGHKVGEIVTVQSPLKINYRILKVKYEENQK